MRREKKTSNVEFKVNSKGNFECHTCGREFSKRGIRSHFWRKHTEEGILFMEKTSTQRIKEMHSQGSIEKMSASIKKAWQDGKYEGCARPSFEGMNHSEETKRKISDAAKKSNHRRLVKSCRKYLKKDGEEVLLDSSWEEELAIRLDYLDVHWIRPAPIRYYLNGSAHNYFPDFYLRDFDLYLDPKNPYAMQVQNKKIEVLKKQIPNLMFLTSIEEIKKFAPCSSQKSSKLLP